MYAYTCMHIYIHTYIDVGLIRKNAGRKKCWDVCGQQSCRPGDNRATAATCSFKPSESSVHNDVAETGTCTCEDRIFTLSQPTSCAPEAPWTLASVYRGKDLWSVPHGCSKHLEAVKIRVVLFGTQGAEISSGCFWETQGFSKAVWELVLNQQYLRGGPG